MDKIKNHALEGNYQALLNLDLPFNLLAKTYALTYNRSIKLKHHILSADEILLRRQQREKALINVTQNIDETLIDQGLKNAYCATLLYEKLQNYIMVDENANILALYLCKVDDDSFNNHVLLYNVYINYNYKNKKGRTMLHVASKVGNIDVVKYLLTQHIDFNYIKGKPTPIHLAIRNHHDVVVKILPVNNIKDDKGFTILHYVCPGKDGNKILFEWLVNHGANINIKHHGKTLLYHAVSENLYPTVEYLLKCGANPYVSVKTTCKNSIYMKQYELCINIAIKKYYMHINDQVSNYRIITILSKYMKI